MQGKSLNAYLQRNLSQADHQNTDLGSNQKTSTLFGRSQHPEGSSSPCQQQLVTAKFLGAASETLASPLAHEMGSPAPLLQETCEDLSPQWQIELEPSQLQRSDAFVQSAQPQPLQSRKIEIYSHGGHRRHSGSNSQRAKDGQPVFVKALSKLTTPADSQSVEDLVQRSSRSVSLDHQRYGPGRLRRTIGRSPPSQPPSDAVESADGTPVGKVSATIQRRRQTWMPPHNREASHEVVTFKFPSAELQSQFAASYVVRKARDKSLTFEPHQLFFLDQMTNTLNTTQSLLIEQSVQTKTDLVERFAQMCLSKTKTDILSLATVVSFLKTALHGVQQVPSTQVLLFQARNLTNQLLVQLYRADKVNLFEQLARSSGNFASRLAEKVFMDLAYKDRIVLLKRQLKEYLVSTPTPDVPLACSWLLSTFSASEVDQLYSPQALDCLVKTVAEEISERQNTVLQVLDIWLGQVKPCLTERLREQLTAQNETIIDFTDSCGSDKSDNPIKLDLRKAQDGSELQGGTSKSGAPKALLERNPFSGASSLEPDDALQEQDAKLESLQAEYQVTLRETIHQQSSGEFARQRDKTPPSRTGIYPQIDPSILPGKEASLSRRRRDLTPNPRSLRQPSPSGLQAQNRSPFMANLTYSVALAQDNKAARLQLNRDKRVKIIDKASVRALCTSWRSQKVKWTSLHLGVMSALGFNLLAIQEDLIASTLEGETEVAKRNRHQEVLKMLPLFEFVSAQVLFQLLDMQEARYESPIESLNKDQLTEFCVAQLQVKAPNLATLARVISLYSFCRLDPEILQVMTQFCYNNDLQVRKAVLKVFSKALLTQQPSLGGSQTDLISLIQAVPHILMTHLEPRGFNAGHPSAELFCDSLDFVAHFLCLEQQGRQREDFQSNSMVDSIRVMSEVDLTAEVVFDSYLVPAAANLVSKGRSNKQKVNFNVPKKTLSNDQLLSPVELMTRLVTVSTRLVPLLPPETPMDRLLEPTLLLLSAPASGGHTKETNSRQELLKALNFHVKSNWSASVLKRDTWVSLLWKMSVSQELLALPKGQIDWLQPLAGGEKTDEEGVLKGFLQGVRLYSRKLLAQNSLKTGKSEAKLGQSSTLLILLGNLSSSPMRTEQAVYLDDTLAELKSAINQLQSSALVVPQSNACAGPERDSLDLKKLALPVDADGITAQSMPLQPRKRKSDLLKLQHVLSPQGSRKTRGQKYPPLVAHHNSQVLPHSSSAAKCTQATLLKKSASQHSLQVDTRLALGLIPKSDKALQVSSKQVDSKEQSYHKPRGAVTPCQEAAATADAKAIAPQESRGEINRRDTIPSNADSEVVDVIAIEQARKSMQKAGQEEAPEPRVLQAPQSNQPHAKASLSIQQIAPLSQRRQSSQATLPLTSKRKTQNGPPTVSHTLRHSKRLPSKSAKDCQTSTSAVRVGTQIGQSRNSETAQLRTSALLPVKQVSIPLKPRQSCTDFKQTCGHKKSQISTQAATSTKSKLPQKQVSFRSYRPEHKTKTTATQAQSARKVVELTLASQGKSSVTIQRSPQGSSALSTTTYSSKIDSKRMIRRVITENMKRPKSKQRQIDSAQMTALKKQPNPVYKASSNGALTGGLLKVQLTKLGGGSYKGPPRQEAPPSSSTVGPTSVTTGSLRTVQSPKGRATGQGQVTNANRSALFKKTKQLSTRDLLQRGNQQFSQNMAIAARANSKTARLNLRKSRSSSLTEAAARGMARETKMVDQSDGNENSQLLAALSSVSGREVTITQSANQVLPSTDALSNPISGSVYIEDSSATLLACNPSFTVAAAPQKGGCSGVAAPDSGAFLSDCSGEARDTQSVASTLLTRSFLKRATTTKPLGQPQSDQEAASIAKYVCDKISIYAQMQTQPLFSKQLVLTLDFAAPEGTLKWTYLAQRISEAHKLSELANMWTFLSQAVQEGGAYKSKYSAFKEALRQRLRTQLMRHCDKTRAGQIRYFKLALISHEVDCVVKALDSYAEHGQAMEEADQVLGVIERQVCHDLVKREREKLFYLVCQRLDKMQETDACQRLVTAIRQGALEYAISTESEALDCLRDFIMTQSQPKTLVLKFEWLFSDLRRQIDLSLIGRLVLDAFVAYIERSRVNTADYKFPQATLDLLYAGVGPGQDVTANYDRLVDTLTALSFSLKELKVLSAAQLQQVDTFLHEKKSHSSFWLSEKTQYVKKGSLTHR